MQIELVRGYTAVALGQLGCSADTMDDFLKSLWCVDEDSKKQIRTTGAALGLWMFGFSSLLNIVDKILNEDENR